MINIGIIGCGKIAQVRHIPEYIKNEHACIYGLYDINRERAEELGKKTGATVYSSYEELLGDKNIDAVSVCAANNAHAEISVKALKSGKHVLCEKPMATKLEDCEAMVKAAEDNQRFLMIGQNQRLTKAHIKAKELIRNGEIGKILTFRTVFGHGGPETWSIDPGKGTWFFDKNKAAMGAMADLGIHKTDLIQYLLEDEVEEVSARLVTLDKRDSEGTLIGVDDNAFCIYQMKSGCIGTMTASWTHYGPEDNSTAIYGTEGMMRIYDDPTYSLKIFKKNGEEIFIKTDKIQTNDDQSDSGIIDMFIDGIVNNTCPPISGSSVLGAMKAVFAAIESSKTGKSVKVR